MLGLQLFDDLGMGTTKDNFQASGNFPILMERLNNCDTEGGILAVVCLSILAEIPSGPFDLEISKLQSISHMIFIMVKFYWVFNKRWNTNACCFQRSAPGIKAF